MKTSKFRTVTYNNRRKVLVVEYTSGKKISLHYGQLGIKSPLLAVWVDPDTKGRSVGLRYKDGREDYLPYDQPLFLSKDPEYLLQDQIERLVAYINATLIKNKVSKKYLARQLATSDNQIQRLLNPNILNKNLEQLYKMTALLGLTLEWQIKEAA